MKQGSSSVDTAAQVRGPGWPEILAGGAAYLASIGLVVLLLPLISAPVVQGNVALLISGLMGIIALIAGAVITPLGEEGFFRGVLANALLARYGAWVGVLVSAAVFAVAHGINPILPVAFVVGVMTALLFRWSGAIWPGVVLHGVNNAVALIVPLMVGVADA